MKEEEFKAMEDKCNAAIARSRLKHPLQSIIDSPPMSPAMQQAVNEASLKAVEAEMAPKLPTLNLTISPSTDESRLNKTEKWFLARLRMLKYPHIGIQDITLKIGDDCRYTPDLNVLDANGQLVFYEVKGFLRDDALVKIKVAARKFSMFKFIMVFKRKDSWEEKEIKP